MIPPQVAAFLHEGLGIHSETPNERLEPAGALAIAVRVDEEGRYLVVFVAELAARWILADLEANGQATVVFGRPTDDRASQVKHTFVEVRPAREDEGPLMGTQGGKATCSSRRAAAAGSPWKSSARSPSRCSPSHGRTPDLQAGHPC